MEFCDIGHRQVCYSGGEGCPACEAKEDMYRTIDSMQDTLDDLTEKFLVAKDTISRIEGRYISA